MQEDVLCKYYMYLRQSEILVTDLVKTTIQILYSSGMDIYLEGLDYRIKKFDSLCVNVIEKTIYIHQYFMFMMF